MPDLSASQPVTPVKKEAKPSLVMSKGSGALSTYVGLKARLLKIGGSKFLTADGPQHILESWMQATPVRTQTSGFWERLSRG